MPSSDYDISSNTQQTILDSINNNIQFDIVIELFTSCSHNKSILFDILYNIKLITVFYNSQFLILPIHKPNFNLYYIDAKNVALNMSTTILYLITNKNVQSYLTKLDNIQENCQRYGLKGKKIMRINSFFIQDSPLIVNNENFHFIVPSKDL